MLGPALEATDHVGILGLAKKMRVGTFPTFATGDDVYYMDGTKAPLRAFPESEPAPPSEQR